MSMATKRGRFGTYNEELLLIKFHDLSIKWSCEVTWQTKTIISPLPLPMNTKLCNLGGFHSQNYMNLWSRDITKSCEKLETTHSDLS